MLQSNDFIIKTTKPKKRNKTQPRRVSRDEKNIHIPFYFLEKNKTKKR